MTQKTDLNPTNSEGYTYFSCYRGQTIYVGSETTPYEYAAGDNEKVWVYDHSFEKLQAQLDKIHAAGGA